MMRIVTMAGLALLAAGCTTESSAPARVAAAPGASGCATFDAGPLGLTGGKVTWHEATDRLPAHCEVSGTLRPVEGSAIGVVYRLPAIWNGKVFGIGGGGWAGGVSALTAAEPLGKGYATMQTDAGHPGTNVWDTSWASQIEPQRDFAYRAIHEMTVAGKAVAGAYYGKPHQRAYFGGCSTGGRMGLMEAQRYPADYDAIYAGAPVYTLQVQTSSLLRNKTFAKDMGGFSLADLKLAEGAAIAACDGDDGLKDGLINDPRQCHWDPAAIQCTGAKTDSCLSAPQVSALRTIYSGVRSSDGNWAMLPMSRGGESSWATFVGTVGTGTDASGGGGLSGLWQHIVSRPANFIDFDPDKDVQDLRKTQFAQWYEAKSPDLSAFFARGGKLLMWHGESDAGPSPVGSNDYARAVLNLNAQAKDQYRYFLAPGVGHCRGGPGADALPLLDVLAAWDASGKAPEVLLGGKDDKSLTRPHCAWPNVARFKGGGDANDPANWSCVARAS